MMEQVYREYIFSFTIYTRYSCATPWGGRGLMNEPTGEPVELGGQATSPGCLSTGLYRSAEERNISCGFAFLFYPLPRSNCGLLSDIAFQHLQLKCRLGSIPVTAVRKSFISSTVMVQQWVPGTCSL